MRKRSVVIVVLVVVAATFVAFFGSMWYVECQRIRDADPAFRPLLSLDPLISSQPIAFQRQCRYVIEFGSNSKLSDARVGELACLNQLPVGNWLELVIETPKVTDRSVAHLKLTHTLMVLDVAKSSISNEGISDLRNALPAVTVVQREAEPADKAQPR